MGRIAREYKKAPFFHVIVQGINKEYIFKKEIYIKKYLEKIKLYAGELKINIVAYCIMSNHAHFLLEIKKIEDMSKLMKKVNSLYAKYYNYMENDRVGYVFRDRYLSEPITSKRYFVQCIKYIHRNPVKANMVKNMEDYKYSSFKYYLYKYLNYKQDENKILDYEDYQYICEENEIEINFLDINIEKKDKVIYNSINEFIKENKIEIYDIFSNREVLKKLILYLKKGKNIKYIEIEDFLEINRGIMEGLKTKKKK